jgi:mRNA interferase MazF
MEKEYKKDFNNWNIVKQKIDKSEIIPYIHERQIWWCSIGVNVGFEQDGKNEQFERPVLVLRKFNKDVVWIVPLTTTEKNNPFHYHFKTNDSSAILSQLRLISTKRFIRKIRSITEAEHREIINKIKDLLP